MCSTTDEKRSAYACSDSGNGDPLDWSGSSSPTVFTTNNKVPNVRLTICGNSNSAPTITGWEIAVMHGSDIGELWCPIENEYIEPRVSGISKLRVCFEEPMNTSLTNANVISIKGVNNGLQPAPCSIEWDGSDCMVINLCSVLPDQDSYTITVGTEVESSAGYILEGGRGICLTTLKGDVSRNREANAQDMLAIIPHTGEPVDCSNALYDINCSGKIDAQDLLAARQYAGNEAPECINYTGY